MKRFFTTATFCLFVSLLTLQESPAPIVEEEKPTPAPSAAQSEAPKRKHSSKSKAVSEEPSSAKIETRARPTAAPTLQGPARFAGTWTGKINSGVVGNIQIKLVTSADARSVTDSSNYGGTTYATRLKGNTLDWHAGWLKEITWTLTPNPDGQTAAVTSKSVLGVVTSATFSRSGG